MMSNFNADVLYVQKPKGLQTKMDNEDIQIPHFVIGNTNFLKLKEAEETLEYGEGDRSDASDFMVTAISVHLKSLEGIQNAQNLPGFNIPSRCILEIKKKLRVMVKRLTFGKDSMIIAPRGFDKVRVFKSCEIQLNDLVPNQKALPKKNGRSAVKNQSLVNKVTFGRTKRGGLQLRYEGFAYHRCVTNDYGTTYWRCAHAKCRGWIKQRGDIYIPTGNHTLCTPYEVKKPKIGKRKVLRCPFCERIFYKKSNWIVHQRTHTEKKRFVCPFCDQRFASVGIWISHKRTHTKAIKSYKCGKCDYKDVSATNMKNHTIRWHDRPFKCQMCQESFLLKATLNRHIRTHAGEKRYACQICKRRFSRNGLSHHKKTHSAIKPFRCDECPYASRYKCDLKRHVKARHSDSHALKSSSMYYSKISDEQFQQYIAKLRK